MMSAAAPPTFHSRYASTPKTQRISIHGFPAAVYESVSTRGQPDSSTSCPIRICHQMSGT
jgi:hypothetical protein